METLFVIFIVWMIWDSIKARKDRQKMMQTSQESFNSQQVLHSYHYCDDVYCPKRETCDLFAGQANQCSEFRAKKVERERENLDKIREYQTHLKKSQLKEQTRRLNQDSTVALVLFIVLLAIPLTLLTLFITHRLTPRIETLCYTTLFLTIFAMLILWVVGKIDGTLKFLNSKEYVEWVKGRENKSKKKVPVRSEQLYENIKDKIEVH